MRKVIYCCIILAFSAASCSREVAVDNGQEPGARHILTGFTASLPGHASPAVKTTLEMGGDGAGSVVWTTDDPVLVSNGSESMIMYIEEGGSTTGNLYSTAELFDGNDFYAVYPGGPGASYSEGVFTVRIPQVQRYVAGGFDTETFPMVAICDENRNFAFRNAASLLALFPVAYDESLLGEEISSVTISAAQSIAGAVNVEYAKGGEPVTDCDGDYSVTVSGAGMRFGDPVYVVVAPGTYTGVSVRVSLQNGVFFKTMFDEPIAVERSRWARVEVPLSNSFENLSAEGTANCYVITKPGSYSFDASIRGNGVVTSAGLEETITGGVSVSVYHSDGEEFVEGDFFYENGRVFFYTKDLLLPGTKLISLKDASGNVLWSWHIWSNPALADVTLSNGQTWLNMNLGALQEPFNSAGYNGYYYQWGRKDPFNQRYFTGTSAADLKPFISAASRIDGSLANSILHPETFYGSYHPSGEEKPTEDWSTYNDEEKVYDWWNANITGDDQIDAEAAKTMFDPCPPGYHVPTYADIESLNAVVTASSKWQNGAKVVEGKLFLPTTSYRAIGIYQEYWTSGRSFFWTGTPFNTGDKHNRKAYRPYYTNSSCGMNGNAMRAWGIPVRCIKEGGATPPDNPDEPGEEVSGTVEDFDPETWE